MGGILALEIPLSMPLLGAGKHLASQMALQCGQARYQQDQTGQGEDGLQIIDNKHDLVLL